MTATVAPRHTGSKGEKLAQRLSHILALLHQGDAIDKHRLADDFGVDVRTIERDLGERLRGIAERSPKGQWQLAHRHRSTIPAQRLHDYARLTGTEHLSPTPAYPTCWSNWKPQSPAAPPKFSPRRTKTCALKTCSSPNYKPPSSNTTNAVLSTKTSPATLSPTG